MTENIKRVLGVTVFIILIVALMPTIVDTVNTAYNQINQSSVSCTEGTEFFGDNFDGADFNINWTSLRVELNGTTYQNGNASCGVTWEEPEGYAFYAFEDPLNDCVVDVYAKITELDEYTDQQINIELYNGELPVLTVTNWNPTGSPDYDEWTVWDRTDESPIYYPTGVHVSGYWDHIVIYYCAINQFCHVIINGTTTELSLTDWIQFDYIKAYLKEYADSVFIDNFHIYDAVCSISTGVTELTGGSGFLALLLIIPFVWVVAVAYYVIRKQIQNESV